MKNSTKFIIIHLISLHFLCMPEIIGSIECCQSSDCPRSPPNLGFPIYFPFGVKHPHGKSSCGSPGFDLYCNGALGPVLPLPNAGNFTVDYIFYYNINKIRLSDPENCLPKKLLSLDLTTTPFREVREDGYTRVYNCSGIGDYDDYSYSVSKIDCLSGSNYTVISASLYTTVSDSNCKFVKDLSLPPDYSSISLTWNVQPKCKPNRSWIVLVACVGCLVIGLCSFWTICCICRLWPSRRNDEQPANNTTNSNQLVSHEQITTPSNVVRGLDQITISSYPTLVIGKSGRLIKSDNDKCPICLTSYSPGDTLKILPECLHRFHVDCIDLWLSTKPTCPICRIFPSHNF